MVSTDGTKTPVNALQGSSKTNATTLVEIEVAESVTVRDNQTDNKDVQCCCCPPSFKGDTRRSHVCYCPLYSVKHVVCPVLTAQHEDCCEDCGCSGASTKCCVPPKFINHCVKYSLCSNECKSTPHSPR